jgi:hypothetical protein
MPTLVTGSGAVWFLGSDKDIGDTIYKPDGTVQDITGWHLDATLHDFLDPSTEYFTKNATIVSPALGLVNIAVDAVDTEDMRPGAYHLRVRRTDPGFVDTVSLVDVTLLQT